MPSNSGLKGLGHIPYDKDDYWREVSAYMGIPLEKGGALTKVQIYDTLGYRRLPKQAVIHQSRANHRIIAGGNRGGKSHTVCMEVLPYLLWPQTKGWVVTRNYDLGDVLRRKIEEELLRAGFQRVQRLAHIVAGTFYYSSKSHMLYMYTGSKLGFKSAENDNSMHAEDLDYIVIDEASLFPFVLYDSRLVPRLVDSGGWILSAGTFEEMQGEWFEEYYQIGQEYPNTYDLQSWSMPTEENFHVYTARGGEMPTEVATLYRENSRKIVKNNPEVEWPLKAGQKVIIYNVDLRWLAEERKRIDPRVYAARYEAKPGASITAVFPTWSLMQHVSREAVYNPRLPVYLAIDPGGTYAVAALQIQDGATENSLTKGKRIVVIDELYFQTTITTEEVYNACKARPWFQGLRRPQGSNDTQGQIDIYGKEQKRAWMRLAEADADLERLVLGTKKVPIEDGTKTLQHYLDTDSLVVNPACRWFIQEMRRYHYPEMSVMSRDKKDPRRGHAPVDEWNHLVKAVIYFLVYRFGYYKEVSGPPANSRKSERTGAVQVAINTRRSRS